MVRLDSATTTERGEAGTIAVRGDKTARMVRITADRNDCKRKAVETVTKATTAMCALMRAMSVEVVMETAIAMLTRRILDTVAATLMARVWKNTLILTNDVATEMDFTRLTSLILDTDAATETSISL